MLRTNFKPEKGTATKERRKRSRARHDKEVGTMVKVRRRDVYCRFPLCGCKRQGWTLDVSHQIHRGLGGNPKGDRTMTETMVLVCRWRHREGRAAIDRKTLRWRALDPNRGANGPIAWELDRSQIFLPSSFMELTVPVPGTWEEIARERAIHVYEPMLDWQREILRQLARMVV